MSLGAFALAYRCAWVRLHQPIDAHGCICTDLSMPLGAFALAYRCHRVRLHCPMDAPGAFSLSSPCPWVRLHWPIDAPGCVRTVLSMLLGIFAGGYPCLWAHLKLDRKDLIELCYQMPYPANALYSVTV